MNIKINMASENNKSLHTKILNVITRVPFGKVATYGQIASEVSLRDSRTVGYALSSLKYKTNSQVPWHRIVNRFGKVSLRDKDSMEHQIELLEEEGIIFDSDGSINLDKFGWE